MIDLLWCDGAKEIPGFPGYRITENGRVFCDRSNREIRSYPNGNGYQRVSLGGRKVYVHQAILLAHVGPPPIKGMEVRHLNGISADNRLSNLAWGTSRENKLDIVRHGSHRNAQKSTCPEGHPYDYTYPSGRRGCRTCILDRKRQRYVPTPPRTHCRRGHEFDDRNTYVRANGSRTCRACINDRQRERRAANAR